MKKQYKNIVIMRIFIKACVAALLLGVTVTACDSYNDNETPGKFVEADKQLDGFGSSRR